MGEEKETWANKARLVILLDIEWKELDHDNLVEFLNTFMIKRDEFFLGRRGVVYVISKHIITNAFGVYQSGYVEDPKGQVTRLLIEELLFGHDVPPYTNEN